MSVYKELKTRKKYRFIIYRLNADNTQIIVDRVLERPNGTATTTNAASAISDYESFISGLPEDDCRYAVYDFEWEKGGSEGIRSKICFLFWAPEVAKVKQKMLYASSKDGLRRNLTGVATEIQGTDYAEVSYETVLEKVNSF